MLRIMRKKQPWTLAPIRTSRSKILPTHLACGCQHVCAVKVRLRGICSFDSSLATVGDSPPPQHGLVLSRKAVNAFAMASDTL